MTTIAPAGFGLDIGSLSLMDFDASTYSMRVLADAFSFGQANVVQAITESLMRDGDVETTAKFGNKTVSFDVQITALAHGGLAAGEARLQAELDKLNELTWRVPFGPPTVFDVVRSWTDFLFNDLDEITKQPRWTFRVFFVVLPFGRSVDPVSIAWSSVGTSVTVSSAGGSNYTSTFVAKNYLRLYFTTNTAAVSSVAVNGVTVASANINTQTTGSNRVIHIPTTAFYGETVTVTYTSASGAFLTTAYVVGYPNRGVTVTPVGISVIDVIGTARAPFTLTWSTANDAFLYTAPDPDGDLRRGMPELKFRYEVTVDPPDNYLITATSSTSRYSPNNLYPTFQTLSSGGSFGEYAYPASTDAKVTYFEDMALSTHYFVSSSPTLPMGSHEGAIAHENQVLHPGQCGFALLNDNAADPISCTITYYPRWKHHAGQ